MKRWQKILTTIMFSFSFCLTCVGYAAISKDLTIKGTADATAQDGVYITDFEYVSNNDAIVGSSEITYAYQTMINSTVTLSRTNKNSSITYEITIYNSNDFDTAFNGIKYLKYDGTVGTYSNEYIIYTLTGLDERDILKSKQYVTFQITFSYASNAPYNCSNVLESIINFQYPRIYYVTYENFTSTTGYPGFAFVEQDLTVAFGSITEPIQVTKKSSGTILDEENYNDTITVSKSNINDNIHFRKMQKYTLKNMVYNSSFEMNHDGWASSGGSGNLVSKTPIVTGGQHGGHRLLRYPAAQGNYFLKQKFNLTKDHKYYFFAYAIAESTTPQPFICNFDGIGSAMVNISVSNKYQKGDVLFTSPSTKEFYLNANWGGTTANLFMDSFCLIDLTLAFTAGNKPSLEWCRSHITYFTREKLVGGSYSTTSENYLYLYK